MTLLETPPESPQAQGAPREPSTAELAQELRRQARSMKATQQAFAIFAVLALTIALANLVAVAFKLDRNGSPMMNVAAPSVVPAGQPATASQPAAPLAHRVGVSLREFSVNPTARTAAAGKVTFAVRNTGRVTHELVVIRTDKPASGLLKGSRADESGNAGETGDLRVGASKTLTLKLKAGHYALICNLAGHYAAGQHTDFTVR